MQEEGAGNEGVKNRGGLSPVRCLLLAIALIVLAAFLFLRVFLQSPAVAVSALTPGEVQVDNMFRAPVLVMLWPQPSAAQPFLDFLNSEYKSPQVEYIGVPETHFSLLKLNGNVSPLILDNEHQQLWRLDGTVAFEKGTVISSEKTPRIILTRREGKFERKWILDFSDNAKGLIVLYSETSP